MDFNKEKSLRSSPIKGLGNNSIANSFLDASYNRRTESQKTKEILGQYFTEIRTGSNEIILDSESLV